MNIRVLKYFLALTKEENLSRAAQALNTTQPNLSRQLSALENEIGYKLFNRGGRKISLTDEGIFLMDRAQEIINLLEKTEQDLAMLDNDISGMIFIGVPDSPDIHYITRAICKVSDNYPGIHFHIISGDYYDLFHNFDEGMLDFCVFTDSVDLRKYDYLKLPGNDTLGILMRRDSPLAALDYIHPGDISDKPVIMSHQMYNKEVLAGWFGTDLKKLQIAATYNLVNIAATLVEDGLGYAFTYSKLVNTEGTELCFRPLKPELGTGSYLTWRKYQFFSKAMRKFIEYVENEISIN